MTQPVILISHALCPYVQRVAIVLHEKDIPFKRSEIDLSRKPNWFLHLSPLGKTPVLLVGAEPIFESAVICEYLDETAAPRLHPLDPLRRARHRAWMEFGSALLNSIAGFYNAPDESTLARAAAGIHARFAQVELVLEKTPYFDGENFCIVDAVFAPIFRYLDAFEEIGEFGLLTELAKVQAWRATLAARPSVRAAVSPRYPKLLANFLKQRSSALSLHMQAGASIES